jgi:hypothetical protein
VAGAAERITFSCRARQKITQRWNPQIWRGARGRHAEMVFVADDLAAWLIFVFAEAAARS